MSSAGHELSWQEARRLAYESASPKPVQTVNLADALGQTLAEPVVALQPIPHYASSAMDGWALSGEPPWMLITPVQEDESPWHRAHEHKKSGYATLEPGQATFILTGGVVPRGATGILRSEHGAIRDGMLTRNDRARPDEPLENEHIRPAGEEAAEGAQAIAAGAVLNPAQIALAAVCGYDTLPVLRAPRVSLLLTGDEVIEAGLPEAGQVRDTFGPQLPGLLTMLGGHVDTVARARDDLDDVVAAISAEATDEVSLARASGDVLISTGGTLLRAGKAARQAGARRVMALVAHGLFMPGAAEVLADPAIDGLVVTDAVPPFRLKGDPALGKVQILPVASLLAETIARLHEHRSLENLLAY